MVYKDPPLTKKKNKVVDHTACLLAHTTTVPEELEMSASLRRCASRVSKQYIPALRHWATNHNTQPPPAAAVKTYAPVRSSSTGIRTPNLRVVCLSNTIQPYLTEKKRNL